MKTIWKIIKGLVTAFLVIVLLIVLFQKVSNNKLALGHTYIFQVASESMLPKYKVGDMIVVRKVEPETLEIGDSVTYLGKSSNLKGLVITHEIIKKEEVDGEYHFVTKGLMNEIEDPEITEQDIYGKVIYHSVFFSYISRLMLTATGYYIIFVSIGVCLAYDIITSYIIKEDEEDESKKDS